MDIFPLFSRLPYPEMPKNRARRYDGLLESRQNTKAEI